MIRAHRVALRPSWRAGVLGAARYEYRMQASRPAVWVVELALLAIVFVGAGPSSPLHLGAHTPLADLAGSWALMLNFLTPIGVGVLLADRGRREHRLGLDDLLGATPTSPASRWWGKALGATAAAVTPVACAWVVMLAVLVAHRGPGVIPFAIAAFGAVILPGLIFVAAFSLALPLLIGPALYRMGLVGYWFWGNLLSPVHHIPTLAGTVFEPIGEYASAGWFGTHTLIAGQRGIHPDTALAALNVALLLAASLAVLASAQALYARRARP